MTSARTAKPRPRPARAAARGAPSLFSLADLEAAAGWCSRWCRRRRSTPGRCWPERTGARGVGQAREPHAHRRLQGARRHRLHGLAEARRHPEVEGVITATRGNHGQSIALAARRARAARPPSWSRTATAPRRTRPWQSFGAELVVHGRDFDEAKAYAAQARRGARPPLRALVRCRSWSRASPPTLWSCYRAVPDLAAVYAPIGMGSGICGLIAARDLLGLEDRDRRRGRRGGTGGGAVVRGGPAGADQLGPHLRRRHGLPRARTRTRSTIIAKGAARIVRVEEDEIAEAIRALLDRHPQRRRRRGRGTAGGPAQGARAHGAASASG